MTKPFTLMLAATLIAGGYTAPTAEAGVQLSITWVRGPMRGANASSASSGVRRQVTAAQTDLNRAYLQAARNDPMASDLKAAQDALAAARQAYAVSLAAGRADVGRELHIAALREEVRLADSRLREQKDMTVRLGIARELMDARNRLNAAEWDVLGIDPDLAIAKASVAQAADALKDVQARRQQQVRQSPEVLAARQRLAGLRRQLAGK